MQIIEAKILDTTHLELRQPIFGQRGEYIQVSIPAGKEEHLWQERAKKHLLEAYDDQDAIYDNL